jgi:hypothetical protein
MIPDWLPPELSLSGNSLQADIDALYAVFERDFINAAASIVDGSPVYVNPHPDPSWSNQYTHGFTHMITKGDGFRGIDYTRARKLPWVKATLNNYTKPEVTAFWSRAPKGDSLYLWLTDYDFVVVLRPKKGRQMVAGQKRILITAFYIDEQWLRRDLQRKYGSSFRQL